MSHDDDFEILRQLGEDGAQGVVSLVEFPNGLRAAMKQFKANKSARASKLKPTFKPAPPPKTSHQT